MKSKKEKAQRVRVAVFMGGPSAEHEVSIKTGQMILKNLNKKKYIGRPIVIKKSGQWPLGIPQLRKKFDVVFIAMHGEYGEDGTLQKILDKAKIPYTGSGVRASQTGMDKAKSAIAFKKAGLRIPKAIFLNGEFKFTFAYPVVVKPSDRGSSVGVSIIEDFMDLPNAIQLAQEYSSNVMVEEYLRGREMTCGVLEIDGKPKAFLPTEIIPRHGKFFDYAAKYEKGASQEITPPRIPKSEIKKIQQVALKAHKAIGAKGFSRTDMIMAGGKIFALELNTIPGLTETSLLPQAAKAEGITFAKLLDYVIENALS